MGLLIAPLVTHEFAQPSQRLGLIKFGSHDKSESLGQEKLRTQLLTSLISNKDYSLGLYFIIAVIKGYLLFNW